MLASVVKALGRTLCSVGSVVKPQIGSRVKLKEHEEELMDDLVTVSFPIIWNQCMRSVPHHCMLAALITQSTTGSSV